MSSRCVLLCAALAACAATVACDETKTVRFRFAPLCAGESCDQVDVSCVTHVIVQFVDAEATGGDGQPTPLGGGECRPVMVKRGTNLCSFGQEIGALPALPTERPFRLRVAAYSRGPRSMRDCDAADLVFRGETDRATDLGHRVDPVVSVQVSECRSARCSGVSGTVVDLMSGGITGSDVSIEFGYVSLAEGRFIATSRAPEAVDPSTGRFALVSDENKAPSSFGCRAYRVSGPARPDTLFCHRQAAPRLPIESDVVYTIGPDAAAKAEFLLDSLLTREGGGGYVFGRILAEGLGVEGAFIQRTAGRTCPAPFTTDGCVWYPDDNLAGFRVDRTTGKLGVFLSAYVTDINPSDTWEARWTMDASRFFTRPRAFFIPRHVFVVDFAACVGATCPT